LTVAISVFKKREGANEVNTLAGALRARLREISRPLGMPVPVYVVFTGLNDLPQFEAYASRLTAEMASEPFGVTLADKQDTSKGVVWAEQEAGRIAKGFQQLFEILSGARLEILGQEQLENRRHDAYLFPREFKKLSRLGPISDFLLELSRPYQLGASPYLRG